MRKLLGGLDGCCEGGGGDRVISEREMNRWFGCFKFGMNDKGEVVVVGQEEHERKTVVEGSQVTGQKGIRGSISRHYHDFNSRHRNKVLLEHGLKLIFITVLGSLLFIVAYYGSTKLSPDNPLERFIGSQTFGVLFLFTGAGGIIDLFWGYFLSRRSMNPTLSQTSSTNNSSRNKRQSF